MKYDFQSFGIKVFNMVKQILFNIALTVCIFLGGILLIVWCGGFRLYEVSSTSQRPLFTTGDIVVVNAKTEYKVGDIIVFKDGKTALPITHRIIGIYYNTNGSIKAYICHGDNVESVNPNDDENLIISWREDSKYIQNLINDGKTLAEIAGEVNDIQTASPKQVRGVVVTHIDDMGTVFAFIKKHYLFVICLILGVYIISDFIETNIIVNQAKRMIK